MSNERLRGALISAGITHADLSAQLGVDPKTVERWITQERKPHRRHRLEAATILSADEAYLWPGTEHEGRSLSATRAELTEWYANRGAVPLDLWSDLLDQAEEAIDLLAFAASFLHDSIPDFGARVAAKARGGIPVRLLFGDPDSAAVALRGREEGIGDLLAARCRLTWTYLRDVLDVPGIDARAHGCTLYASVFRFDDRMLVNGHLYGAPAAQSPVQLVTRIPGGRLFANHMNAYERVWQTAEPFRLAA